MTKIIFFPIFFQNFLQVEFLQKKQYLQYGGHGPSVKMSNFSWLRPRPHISRDFCICKFFYADRPSLHTCPYARCIRRFLYTFSRVEISVYAVYPDTCGRSCLYIFVYADVTVSEPVFFCARFSKTAASRNVVFNATRTTFKPNSVSRTKCCNVKSKL